MCDPGTVWTTSTGLNAFTSEPARSNLDSLYNRPDDRDAGNSTRPGLALDTWVTDELCAYSSNSDREEYSAAFAALCYG